MNLNEEELNSWLLSLKTKYMYLEVTYLQNVVPQCRDRSMKRVILNISILCCYGEKGRNP